MKKLLTATLIFCSAAAANAVSLCEDAPVEACARAIGDFYATTFAEAHQKKESPVSKEQFATNLKEAVGFEPFLDLYKKCTESAKDTDAAISCINSGFSQLLIRKVDNPEIAPFIQKTLPDIVASWDVETFRKNAISFFPMEDYPKVSQTANLLFGGCQIGDITENGRKFEMTYGLPMHDYTVNLTCDKIKQAKANLLIVNENGNWKYARMDVRKNVEINFGK